MVESQQKKHFELFEASNEDLEIILSNIAANKRQSMNIRHMTNRKIFVLKEDSTLVGWIGVSLGHFDSYAEYFSLFVKPEYRGLGLGLYLEFLVVEEAHRKEFPLLHFRVDSAVSLKLTESRLRSGSISMFTPSEQIRTLCTLCELHGKECQNQTFMVIDTSKRFHQLLEQLEKYNSHFTIHNKIS